MNQDFVHGMEFGFFICRVERAVEDYVNERKLEDGARNELRKFAEKIKDALRPLSLAIDVQRASGSRSSTLKIDASRLASETEYLLRWLEKRFTAPPISSRLVSPESVLLAGQEVLYDLALLVEEILDEQPAAGLCSALKQVQNAPKVQPVALAS